MYIFYYTKYSFIYCPRFAHVYMQKSQVASFLQFFKVVLSSLGFLIVFQNISSDIHIQRTSWDVQPNGVLPHQVVLHCNVKQVEPHRDASKLLLVLYNTIWKVSDKVLLFCCCMGQHGRAPMPYRAAPCNKKKQVNTVASQ